jgi:hypothetical protein
MTKYEAQIKFSKEAFDIIEWFTVNFNKEVGALGIGDVINGEMYIEKLVFPTQIVNGVHVHFKPEDWAEIVQELPMEDLKRICFYWHKHPDNMPGASAGDEEDTFDVFMDPEAGRRMFGFLQTCNSKTGLQYEARIEMRKPIWCSITNVGIYTERDLAIQETCEKIIEDKITFGTAGASDQPGATKYIVNGNTISKEQEFDYVNTDIDVVKKNGWVCLTFDPELNDIMEEIINSKEINDLWKDDKTYYMKDSSWIIELQPKKKCLDKLYKAIKETVEKNKPKLENLVLEKLIAQQLEMNENAPPTIATSKSNIMWNGYDDIFDYQFGYRG